MNKNNYVIGLFGASESGKNTVAQILIGKLVDMGYRRVYQYALAQPLKEACRVLGVTKGNKDFRQLVCGIGDVVREINVDYLWNVFINEQIESKTNSIFVLNDPRYQDQAEHCDYTVKLIRTGIQSRMTSKEKEHATETDWRYIETDATYPNEDPEDPWRIADLIIASIKDKLPEKQ